MTVKRAFVRRSCDPRNYAWPGPIRRHPHMCVCVYMYVRANARRGGLRKRRTSPPADRLALQLVCRRRNIMSRDKGKASVTPLPRRLRCHPSTDAHRITAGGGGGGGGHTSARSLAMAKMQLSFCSLLGSRLAEEIDTYPPSYLPMRESLVRAHYLVKLPQAFRLVRCSSASRPPFACSATCLNIR